MFIGEAVPHDAMFTMLLLQGFGTGFGQFILIFPEEVVVFSSSKRK
jgi:hypothetical protein